MNGYILLTYDALIEFASGRKFQSSEFSQSGQLCDILSGNDTDWNHPAVYLKIVEGRGLIFHTRNIDRKRGLLFDLDTFHGFEKASAQSVITIFQKTVKYAIRYFEGQPLAPCEMDLSADRALVYPYPFVATRGVEKVLLDKNSTKQNRKEQNFLVAYYFGKEDGNFVQTNLNKAVSDLQDVEVANAEDSEFSVDSLSVKQMESPSLLINSPMDYKAWNQYLTKVQQDFVQSPIKGAERLEGPAGSGKTLSLILRCIHLIETHEKRNEACRMIFITHSLPTKKRIVELFKLMYPNYNEHVESRDEHPMVSILVTTLQEWCRENLGANVIYDTEMIDRDASVAKGFQMMMIEEAYKKVKKAIWNGYESICSNDFVSFINRTRDDCLLNMFQYEISVVIKGRAEGNLEKYKMLERPKWGIPLQTVEDKMYMFRIYEEYQEALEHSGQFDTDDITLSALGQLDTPIWKRRSVRDGYDACFIDEAHLFNFNELSVFHFLNKPAVRNHIVYVLDKSQYSGEVGFTEKELGTLTDGDVQSTRLHTVFRSSPEIVNLAFNVLSSSVSLFSNFENPLDFCSSPFTKEEESKCENPRYKLLLDDQTMIECAIADAEAYCQKHGVGKSDVLIVVTDDCLLNNDVVKYLRDCNKPYITLQSRNDYDAINKAMSGNKFVVGGIDYVGGLEFNAVLIVGVDKGRVPPEDGNAVEGSRFMSYAWHNRMYVAITRAKYMVSLYGNVLKGKSSVLETATINGVVGFESVE